MVLNDNNGIEFIEKPNYEPTFDEKVVATVKGRTTYEEVSKNAYVKAGDVIWYSMSRNFKVMEITPCYE